MKTLEKEQMRQLKGKQVRNLSNSQLRAEEAEGKKVIRGYALTFNSPTKPFRGMQYTEQIGPHALDGLDLSGIRLLVNHNVDLTLGKVGVNMRAEVDPIGLFVEAELHAGVQMHKDYYNLLRAGIIDGMSFAFAVDVDDLEYDRDKDIYTITRIADLWEASIVTFPAYEDTVAIARAEELPELNAPAVEPEQSIPEAAPADIPEVGPVPVVEEEAEAEPATERALDADVQKRAALLAEIENLIGGHKANAD